MAQAGFLIKTLNAQLERSANNTLREDGITLSQIALLLELRAAGGTCKMKDLERSLCVSQPTIAGLVKRLKRAGFVTTDIDAEDRRAKHVNITEQGTKTCDLADKRMQIAEEHLLRGLKEEERDQLKSLLVRLLDNVSDM